MGKGKGMAGRMGMQVRAVFDFLPRFLRFRLGSELRGRVRANRSDLLALGWMGVVFFTPGEGNCGVAFSVAFSVFGCYLLLAGGSVRFPTRCRPLLSTSNDGNGGKAAMKLQVILEPSEEGGFTAIVPTLPGCISEGDTGDEAIRNIREAIELYLEAV